MKILLIDEHVAVLEGLRDYARQHGSAEVVSVIDRNDIRAKIDGSDFDIVVADVLFKNIDTLSMLSGTSSRLSFPTIVFTAMQNPTYIARSFALSAIGYIFKSSPPSVLIQAIDSWRGGQPAPVHHRVAVVGALVTSDYDSDNEPFDLTNREGQVLRHLGLGLSNREIAGSLSISIETVKEHVQNILRKIDANDRTDAAVKAVRSGMLTGT